jgi:sugar O-acyltransferase (sialic acid O-acetyltransferase NeuD family)
MTTLYLCGAGNPEGIRLALKINKTQNRWNRIVILDDDSTKHGQSILGVEIAGPFTVLEQADKDSAEISNMVAGTTRVRRSALRKIQAYGLPFASLIDPAVDITGVDFGQDITVYPNALLCANASVGDGAVVLMGAIVGHGCRVGRCCVVAPGAVINARVELGDGVYVGTNASIVPDLKIGPWATIGANSAVVQDVPAGATVMGVPAQVLIPGDAELSGAASVGSSYEQQDPGETFFTNNLRPDTVEIRSDKLRKLRAAQEKFIANHRSAKT